MRARTLPPPLLRHPPPSALGTFKLDLRPTALRVLSPRPDASANVLAGCAASATCQAVSQRFRSGFAI
jgi:hypothetical protein